MLTSKIDISEVVSCIEQNKTFDEIKSNLNENDVTVREYNNESDENLKNLYLVVVNKEIEENPDLTDLQRQANGLIIEKETNKVVAMCQNKMHNIGEEDVSKMELEKFSRVEYCEDGTMIRLYNYNGHWYTATTRCPDARKSFWSSNKTFDDMFWEVFDRNLLNTLDTSYTYVFVLLHKENRIVVYHKYNTLIYISRIHNTTFLEDYKNIFYGLTKNIKRPQAVELFDDLSQFIKPYKRGILFKVYNKANCKWDIYKYDFPDYITIKQIRGNVPDVKYRVLELLNDPMSLTLLEKHYPENKFLFNVIKHSILKIVNTVHKLYIESHIKRSIKVEEDNKYYRTLKQLHAQYKTHNKPITYEDVQKKVYSLDKHVLKSYLDWS